MALSVYLEPSGQSTINYGAHCRSCSLHSEHISSIIPYMSGAGAGWGNQAAIMVHQNFILYCNKWLGNSLFILNKNSCRQRIALCKVPMITKKENLHCLKAATNIKLRPHDCRPAASGVRPGFEIRAVCNISLIPLFTLQI